MDFCDRFALLGVPSAVSVAYMWCMMTHNDAAMTAGRQMERGNPTKPPQQAVVLPRSVPHTLKDGVTRMAHVGNGPPFYRGGRFSADGNFTSYRAMMSSDASVDK